MRQNNIYKYYAFGFNHSLLLRDGLVAQSKAQALAQLKRFFTNLDELDLQVTKVAATNLQTVLDKLEKGEDQPVSPELAKEICAAVTRLDATLDAELQLRKSFLLTKKRYPIETLMESPEELLGAGVWEKLADTARRDFKLATIQVALNQPTASAFHLMRCLEANVKSLYFAFKKTKRLENPMWGPMVSQLRAKRAPRPSDKLLNHLDSMRIHFRNPTQHPNAFYTPDECQDLLNQTIAATNMIWAEIP